MTVTTTISTTTTATTTTTTATTTIIRENYKKNDQHFASSTFTRNYESWYLVSNVFFISSVTIHLEKFYLLLVIVNIKKPTIYR